MARAGKRVLLTRPRDRSERLAKALEREGWRVFIWPVIEIEPLLREPPKLGDAAAVLFTSARGVEAAGAAASAPPPAFCVGAATAAAARAAGYGDVRSADGDAAALAALVKARARPEAGPLVHVRGEHSAGDVAEALEAEGFDVRSVVAYRAAASDGPPPEIVEALEAGVFDAAAFYSPRSGAIFAGLMRPEWRAALAATTAVAISAAAAAALSGAGFGRIVVAAAPNGDAMRAAICGAA